MQQDYLERQIEQMARILGRIFANLLRLKSKGQVNAGIEIANQTLKSELDFDIEELMELKNDDLIDFLVKEKKLSNENLEKLTEIFLLIADDVSTEKRKMIYERCLLLYKYMEGSETTFSVDRQLRIKEIENACYNDFL